MGDHIRSANSESSIQHPQAEHKPITGVTCVVLPVSPHEVGRSISVALSVRGNGTNDDSNEQAGQDEEASKGFNGRERLIRKENDQAAAPDTNQIGHEHLPSLGLEVWVEQSVHRNGLGAEDLSGGGDAEDPGEEVPPAGKETEDSPIAPSRNRCPVVDYKIC
jgi:hypothetical protein